MSSSNCCLITCPHISQEAGQMVWHSHLFQNFPQLGIPNYQLNNLFNTLKGDPDSNSPCSLSQETGEELFGAK